MKSKLKKLSKLFFDVLKYGCVAHCFLEYVGDFVLCSGMSMEPTIYTGDIVLTEHIGFLQPDYHRGDIVIARSPVNPHQFICKRVKYLPGDLVNDGFNFIKIPKGHVWLTGDNQNNSLDSRTYGPVPQALIRGRAVYKVWPLNRNQKLCNRWI